MAEKEARNIDMSESASAPEIFERLHQLQAALSRVGAPKQGRNREQGYAFRAWDDVQQALSPALAATGVVILPDIEERTETTAQTTKGTTIYRVLLRGRIRFIAPDGSQVSFQAFGEAADTGDKATSKALTMMVKYGILHALQIPLQGVDDADATTPEETVSAQADVDRERLRATTRDRLRGCVGVEELRRRYKELTAEQRSSLTPEDLDELKREAAENENSAHDQAERAAQSRSEE